MSEDHNTDSGVSYRRLLVYQDHLIKFVRLRPLKNKCEEEVADVLEDSFCEIGIHHMERIQESRRGTQLIRFRLVTHFESKLTTESFVFTLKIVLYTTESCVIL